MIGRLLALFGFAMSAGAMSYSPTAALAGIRTYPFPPYAGKSGVAAIKRAAAKARNKRRARRA